MTTQQTDKVIVHGKMGGTYFCGVPSSKNPDQYYLVSKYDCNCKGFIYRRTCRHIRIVAAALAARECAPNQ